MNEGGRDRNKIKGARGEGGEVGGKEGKQGLSNVSAEKQARRKKLPHSGEFA
jgi:hypothetical protein